MIEIMFKIKVKFVVIFQLLFLCSVIILLCLHQMKHSTPENLQHSTLLRSSLSVSQLRSSYTVVFLVRTYFGHFDTSKVFNIVQMLTSLQKQQHQQWRAYLINTDMKPLPIEGSPVKMMMNRDRRIMQLNLPVRRKYDKWYAGYEVTDEAIDLLRAFNPDIDFIVITNGDNMYESNFISSMNLSYQYDIYFANYWSRYDRDSRNAIAPINMSATQCHEGRLERGYVDLGGVALSFKRFIESNIKFMDYGAVNGQDGIMFSDAVYQGWTWKHVPVCAYSHAPNPYGCHKLGGKWFESASSVDEVSDSCWSNKDLESNLHKRGGRLLLSLSESGIITVRLPEPYHGLSKTSLKKSEIAFGIDFIARMRAIRAQYCANLLSSPGFQLNTTDYKLLNFDLAKLNLSDEALREHFRTFGCFEIRPLSTFPPNYFIGARRPLISG
jgi:hypothetical protein